MISDELRRSLTDLQVAAVERLALREGIPAGRLEIQRLIEQGGMAHAQEQIRRNRQDPQLQSNTKEAAPPVSFLKRLGQMWFGRG
jgi:hypothetical protein